MRLLATGLMSGALIAEVISIVVEGLLVKTCFWSSVNVFDIIQPKFNAGARQPHADIGC